MDDYRQRLIAFLKSMPRGKKVEMAKIVKEENQERFRNEYYSIIESHWNEWGYEFTCDEELTYIRRSDAWELSPIVPGQVSINNKIIGNLNNWKQ